MASTSLLQKGLRDPGVRWIGAGWTAFILENLILSENRQKIIDAVGDDNYHLAYSSLSTLACGSIFYGYIRYGRGKGVALSPPGPLRNITSFLFRTLGLVGLSQQIPQVRMPYTYENIEVSEGDTRTVTPAKKWRCPMEYGAHTSNEDEIKGMQRVSRHSTFWSLGLIGLGAAARTSFLPEAVMFAFPSVFALIGGAHQDHRFLKNSVVTGKQSLSKIWDEMKLPNMGIAVCASVLYGLRHIKR